jgi:hypothetical protein
MPGHRVRAFALACVLAATSAACGPSVPLDKTLAVTDVFSGWYDAGVTSGLNHLVPSITFRLKNTGSEPIDEVQLTVSFWQDGADGEWESQEVRGIGADAVAPGASSNPILVRSSVGYTLEQPRAELFTHRDFKDASAKIFAKRNGKIVPIGQFPLERRIIPHLTQTASVP